MKNLAAALGTVLGLTACGSACTLIGCDGVLTIQFETPAQLPYQIELLSVDYGARQFSCSDVRVCPTAAITNYSPVRMVVSVTNARGTRQYNVSPSYTGRKLNGSDCGDTCRDATVTIAAP